MKSALPRLSIQNKPEGLRFRAPASAVQRWDPSIKAAAKQDNATEIAILGEIGPEEWGGVGAASVRNALKAAGRGPVLVSLNSPGGDAFEGIAMYNLLRDHPGDVTVRVLGLAASAASVVAMAGDRVEMGEGAQMMIHSAWAIIVGNRNDMRQFADILDGLDNSIAELYAGRTGMAVAEVMDMMDKETWLDAHAAVEHGFADAAMAGGDKRRKSARAAAQPLFLDRRPAASGARAAVRLSSTPLPGASGSQRTPKGSDMKTPYTEQLAALEAKRAASVARREEIQNKAINEGRGKDAAEKEEFDTLTGEIEACDVEIKDLKLMEAQAIATATPVARVETPEGGSQARTPSQPGAPRQERILAVRSNLEPGVRMARFAMALVRSKGVLNDALSVVRNERRWMDTSPDLEKVMMAAVAAGDTTTSGWASELAYAQDMQSEFVEYLRPMTILGKMTTVRRVPFNIRYGTQTATSTGNWVGQGAPVPVSKPTVSSGSLGIAKASALVAIDEELARLSTPSAELLVRDDMARTLATFLDVQFVDPNVAAVANVNPASITNGVTAVAATGTAAANLRTDLATILTNLSRNEIDLGSVVWIMTPETALNISLLLTSLGTPIYPDINATGGKLLGLPVITSNSANIPGSPASGRMIIACAAPEILLADDGGVTIDVSREASIQLLDNPTNASTGSTTATTMVSMFQTHSLALRATRFINWGKRRTTAVEYIKEAAYAA